MADALARAKRLYPDDTPEEQASAAQEIFHDWMQDWAAEREREGFPEDSPCLESCDQGTGEGRWHGVIR
jgi:hypothetical protein